MARASTPKATLLFTKVCVFMHFVQVLIPIFHIPLRLHRRFHENHSITRSRCTLFFIFLFLPLVLHLDTYLQRREVSRIIC